MGNLPELRWVSFFLRKNPGSTDFSHFRAASEKEGKIRRLLEKVLTSEKVHGKIAYVVTTKLKRIKRISKKLLKKGLTRAESCDKI